MNDVAEWLMTDEGMEWSREKFDNPGEYHELIEIIDDTHHNQICDHMSVSAANSFQRMRNAIREWRDLTWNPDSPP